jgi:hypothetical protein
MMTCTYALHLTRCAATPKEKQAHGGRAHGSNLPILKLECLHRVGYSEALVPASPGADVASPGADVASPGADVASPGADVASLTDVASFSFSAQSAGKASSVVQCSAVQHTSTQ